MARSAAAVAGLTLALGMACSAKTLPYAGGLMVAVQTDLTAPKDVAAMGLYITSDGRPIFGDTRAVAPNGDVKFPATLAVLADANRPGAVVKIRAVAFNADGNIRVLRDILTTIPKGRTGLLRAPLLWINEGSGTGNRNQLLGSASIRPLDATADGFSRLTSACADGQTFIEGECADAYVDGESLPDYVEADVFGGGNAAGSGSCFDVPTCFADRTPVTLDLASCTGTIAGVDPNDPNLSISVSLPPSAATGECLAAGICLVPLDKELVWKVRGSALAFPRAICTRIAAGQATELVATRSCPGKDVRTPLCGPASAVAPRPSVDRDAGVAVPPADFETPIVSKRNEALLADVAVDNQNLFLARAQPSLPAGVVRIRKSDITTLTQPEDFQVLFNYPNGVEQGAKIALDSTSNATRVIARGPSGQVFLCTPASAGSCPDTNITWPGFRMLAAGVTELFAFGNAASGTGLYAVPYAAPEPELRVWPSSAGVTALMAYAGSLYFGLDDGSIHRCAMPCKVAGDLSQVRAPTTPAAPVTALAATDKVPGKLFVSRLPLEPGNDAVGGVFVVTVNDGAEQKLATLEELFGPLPGAEPPSALAVDGDYVYWGGGFVDPRDNARKGGVLRRNHRTLAPAAPFLEPTQGIEPVTAIAIDDTHVFWTYYRADRSLLFAKKTRPF